MRFRGHVAGTLAVLSCCFTISCASSGAVPAPFPRPGTPAASSPPAPDVASSDLVSTALGLRGVPYRDGGSDPSGFDCSGFVEYVFARHGLWVPRTVLEQYRFGQTVDPGSLREGDLVFFSTVAPGPSHVGIVVSRDEFVHAPSSSGVVRVEHLSSAYWGARFIGARRLP